MSNALGKANVDLDQLVADGHLDFQTAQMLSRQSTPPPYSGYLINVLYIIGALAAAAGVVLLKPTATTGLIIAIICLIFGQFIQWKNWPHLRILSLALGIGAAAGLSGWFVLEFGQSLSAMAVNGFITTVTFAMSLLFRSRFLSALVPLCIGNLIGSGGAYWHASYGIFVREAAISIVLFTALCAALYWVTKRLSDRAGSMKEDWSVMPEVAARMSFIIANFGFWVGSLWGDYVGDHLAGVAHRLPNQDWNQFREARDAYRETAFFIHDNVFTIGWAAFAVAAIALGNRLGNRFIAISGVVFLCINAFTQYFEYFRDEPWALVIGGIALVAIALGLVRWEMRKNTQIEGV